MREYLISYIQHIPQINPTEPTGIQWHHVLNTVPKKEAAFRIANTIIFINCSLEESAMAPGMLYTMFTH